MQRKLIRAPDGQQYEIITYEPDPVHVPTHIPPPRPMYPPAPYHDPMMPYPQQPISPYGEQRGRQGAANTMGVLVGGFFLGIVGGMATDVAHPEWGAVFAWSIWGGTIAYGVNADRVGSQRKGSAEPCS